MDPSALERFGPVGTNGPKAEPTDDLRRLARKVLDLYHGPEYMRAREDDRFGGSEADMRVDQMVAALTESALLTERDALMRENEELRETNGRNAAAYQHEFEAHAATLERATEAEARATRAEAAIERAMEVLRPYLDTGDSRTADGLAVAAYAALAHKGNEGQEAGDER